MQLLLYKGICLTAVGPGQVQEQPRPQAGPGQVQAQSVLRVRWPLEDAAICTLASKGRGCTPWVGVTINPSNGSRTSTPQVGACSRQWADIWVSCQCMQQTGVTTRASGRELQAWTKADVEPAAAEHIRRSRR